MNNLHPEIQPNNASRREFLKRASVLSVAGSAGLPLAMSLSAISEAAAATATDYKAIVCVFLNGGNDYANTLVPYDSTNYNSYASLRSNIAIPQSSLIPTVLTPTTALPGGARYALHPNLAKLLPIFNAGKLAPILNVGTLMQPITKTQWTSGKAVVPPKLFSHNDQQSYVQSFGVEGTTTGWGGRIGDLYAAGNGNSTFTCISVTGNAVFVSGQSAVQYQVTPNGAVPITGIKSALFGSAACSSALRDLMIGARTNLFENEYSKITSRALTAGDQLTAGLTGAPAIATAFPANNWLGNQLKMVAKLISARNTLGAKRQVFFVSTGGFDTHSNLLTEHANLMTNLNDALAAFYAATVELGISDKVATFTASDFGRTLVSNDSGSDHGWGGVQFVMGGGVLGKSFVGTSPVFANNGPNDVGQGRLIPTTSVDQLASTLATWMGVSDSEQTVVLPNLKNFSTKNLGFMAPA